MCILGRPSQSHFLTRCAEGVGLIEQDVKPAKQIIDEMISDAKQCIDRGAKLAGGQRAKL
jgi:hypothetical protein